jgi:hypothetical protein
MLAEDFAVAYVFRKAGRRSIRRDIPAWFAEPARVEQGCASFRVIGAIERMSDDEKGVADAGKASGRVDPLGTNSEIGRKLRQYYDELVSDDVPDRFAQLLSQLEGAETSRKEG